MGSGDPPGLQNRLLGLLPFVFKCLSGPDLHSNVQFGLVCRLLCSELCSGCKGKGQRRLTGLQE